MVAFVAEQDPLGFMKFLNQASRFQIQKTHNGYYREAMDEVEFKLEALPEESRWSVMLAREDELTDTSCWIAIYVSPAHEAEARELLDLKANG